MYTYQAQGHLTTGLECVRNKDVYMERANLRSNIVDKISQYGSSIVGP